jgi:hypothetical protein
LGFLPDFLSVEAAHEENACEGLLLAIPVMKLENGYISDGWAALLNLRDDLPGVIYAYEKIGLEEEAHALRAVVAQLYRGVENISELVSTYKSVASSFSDDYKRAKFLKAYFCSNRRLFHRSSPKV